MEFRSTSGAGKTRHGFEVLWRKPGSGYLLTLNAEEPAFEEAKARSACQLRGQIPADAPSMPAWRELEETWEELSVAQEFPLPRSPQRFRPPFHCNGFEPGNPAR